VRLNGYGFTSFDAIHSNMMQAGPNVLLNLGSGEILEFKDTTIDKLQPSQFELPIDKSAMSLSFSDDQARVVAPSEAVAAGATYIVVGRPITEAPDPAAEAQAILSQIASYQPTAS